MNTTRSAQAAADGSWVTITSVRPPSSMVCRSSSRTERPERLSRAPVGSSAKITSGSPTSARAIATRCCWPPESCAGRWRARSPSPTRSSTSRTAERGSRRPASRDGSETFCSAVSAPSRLKDWKTKPMRSRRRPRQRPLAELGQLVLAEPDAARWSGRSSPAALCSSVDLPDPEGPMIAVNGPRRARA